MLETIIEDINLDKTYDSGQVFSWVPKNGAYFIPIKNRLYRAEQIEPSSAKCTLVSKTFSKKDEKEGLDKIKSELFFYFDVQKNYPNLYDYIEKKHPELKNGVEYGRGIRLLRQDSLEMLITFILSANNNISRIRGSLAKIRQNFGTSIPGTEKGSFYTFPDLKALSNISVEDFQNFGAGYRAPYLNETIGVLMGIKDYNVWDLLSTDELIKQLSNLKGIGPKVAHCIALFGYGRWDVFPIDTWIKKALFKYYGIEKPNKKVLDYLINEKFKENSALVQQIMFYQLKTDTKGE